MASIQSRFFERLGKGAGNSLIRPPLDAVSNFLPLAPFRTNGKTVGGHSNGKWRKPTLVERKWALDTRSTFSLRIQQPFATTPPSYRFATTAGDGYVD